MHIENDTTAAGAGDQPEHWPCLTVEVDDTDSGHMLEFLLAEDEDDDEDDEAEAEVAAPTPAPVVKRPAPVAVTRESEEERLLAAWSNLRLKLDKDTVAAMVGGDVPMDAVLTVRNFNFDLTKHVQPYSHDEDGHSQHYMMLAQLEELDAWLERSLNGSPPETLVISGTPNDARAKAVAAFIFARAVQAYQRDPQNFLARRVSLPRWHQVIGGFNDSVVKEKREKKAESDPLLWVFSNVMDDSTAAKVENLRDSLQLYAHRPRIIVTSNANPRAFMNRLRIGAAAHLYVR